MFAVAAACTALGVVVLRRVLQAQQEDESVEFVATVPVAAPSQRVAIDEDEDEEDADFDEDGWETETDEEDAAIEEGLKEAYLEMLSEQIGALAKQKARAGPAFPQQKMEEMRQLILEYSEITGTSMPLPSDDAAFDSWDDGWNSEEQLSDEDEEEEEEQPRRKKMKATKRKLKVRR